MDTLSHQLGNTYQAFYGGTMREATKILKNVLRRTPSLSAQFSTQQLADIEQEKGQIMGKVLGMLSFSNDRMEVIHQAQ